MSDSPTSHDRQRDLVERWIAGTASAREWREARAHLQACVACRAHYDRLVLAERMLHGGPAALERPSPAAFERIGAAVLDGAAQEPSAWRRAAGWLAPRSRWAVAIATVAAAVVLVPRVVRSPSSAPSSGSGFQARGSASAARAAGLRAFCLDDRGVTPRCARASVLRLTVSNSGRFPYVFLVGVDDQWALKWYAPRPPAEVSIRAPDGVDVPVGPAVRLGVNHDPGKVRIYALFSDAPLPSSEIEAAVEELRRLERRPSQEETLPLARGDVLQRSVLVDVQP
jgi:hypothetical protein